MSCNTWLCQSSPSSTLISFQDHLLPFDMITLVVAMENVLGRRSGGDRKQHETQSTDGQCDMEDTPEEKAGRPQYVQLHATACSAGV